MEQGLSAITLYCAPPAAARAMEPEQQLANGERGFENVELGVIGKKKKIPRRVIHFASGETMEEYSTDEEDDEQEKKDLLPPVDPEFRWTWKRLPIALRRHGARDGACPRSALRSRPRRLLLDTSRILLRLPGSLLSWLLGAFPDTARSFVRYLTRTTLTWGPYLWFHMLRVATSTLSVCDFLGEKIASVLGISTPKYQYAIDEYYRMKKEEEEEEQENKMSEEAERQHREQQNKAQAEAPVQTDQPEATSCSSFVNLNFEAEGDCQPVVADKQDGVTVPP